MSITADRYNYDRSCSVVNLTEVLRELVKQDYILCMRRTDRVPTTSMVSVSGGPGLVGEADCKGEETVLMAASSQTEGFKQFVSGVAKKTLSGYKPHIDVQFKINCKKATICMIKEL